MKHARLLCFMALKQFPAGPVRRSIRQTLVTMGAIILSVMGLSATPASAAGSVPRFIPSRVAAGYTLSDSTDRTTPRNTIRYLRYLRNEANTAAIYVVSEPAQKSEWDSLTSNLRSAGFKATKVRALKAFVDETDGVRLYYWFDKNRIIFSRSINMPVKTQQALNNSVVVTKLPDASFGMKTAPGFRLSYAGQYDALFGSFSEISWVNDSQDELYLDVTSIDPRMIEVVLLTPFARTSTTTVNGKPAYVVETPRYTEVFWEDQPGLLVEVWGTSLNAAALADMANSVAPTDEAAWQAYVATAGKPSTTGTGGGASGGPVAVAGALVGAGMADGIPWTAELGAGPTCLKFKISTVASEACVKTGSLGWALVTVDAKTFVVGAAAANVVTAVVKGGAGAEIARAAVGPVTGQPLLRLFVVPVPAGSVATTVSGLDAAGTEVSPAVAAGA
jgi:hypothetical protein